MVIDHRIVISEQCGQNGHCYACNRVGGWDLSEATVGQTWKGDHFCAQGFYGQIVCKCYEIAIQDCLGTGSKTQLSLLFQG